MEKLLRVAEMRDLEKQVDKGEISYSRMVEIINEKHFKKLVESDASVAYKLIEEAKKEAAIGFAEWLPLNAQPRPQGKNQWWHLKMQKEVTILELYAEYLTQLK